MLNNRDDPIFEDEINGDSLNLKLKKFLSFLISSSRSLSRTSRNHNELGRKLFFKLHDINNFQTTTSRKNKIQDSDSELAEKLLKF